MSWRPDHWYGEATIGGRHVELHHLSLAEFREFSGRRFEDFETFAVVRDPYQRLISEFHWREGIARNDPDAIRTFESFDDLVAAIPWDLEHQWRRYLALADRKQANLLIHLRPQWQSVCDLNGHRDPTVEIVRFEHLHDDFEPLRRRWHLGTGLERRSPSPRALGDYYTAETLAVVNRVYARDLEWFGYPTVTEPT